MRLVIRFHLCMNYRPMSNLVYSDIGLGSAMKSDRVESSCITRYVCSHGALFPVKFCIGKLIVSSCPEEYQSEIKAPPQKCWNASGPVTFWAVLFDVLQNGFRSWCRHSHTEPRPALILLQFIVHCFSLSLYMVWWHCSHESQPLQCCISADWEETYE